MVFLKKVFYMKDYLKLLQNDFIIVVNGESMMPRLYHGEKVRCKILRDNIEINIGSIIIFYNHIERRYVIHRVLDIRKTYDGQIYYITKGDRNLVKDDYLVTPEYIRGVI